LNPESNVKHPVQSRNASETGGSLKQRERFDLDVSRRQFLNNASHLVLNPIASLGTSDRTQLLEGDSGEKEAVMAKLSAYMAAAVGRVLPGEVVEKAKHHILDTIAAMISGADLPPAKLAMKFVRNYGGDRVATVVGSDMLCGPIEAAMGNGMLAHSDETDDSHAPSQSHPGCGIIPAALALGEQFAIGGEQLLRAVVLGYDIGTRVAVTLGGESYQTKTSRDTHSITNCFGAAAAGGCAAGLNMQQMRWALDYAAQQASGIAAWQRDTQHVEKSLVFGGFPARDGVTAALLVKMGGTGVNDIFSGADNFLATFGPSANAGGLIERLGERFEVTRTNIKKWTVGSPIQAPLDALELLMRRNRFKPGQVQKVVVRIGSSEAHIVDNRDMPDICLQHMVAVMLIDGTVTFKSAHDEGRMQDPSVVALRSRVELVRDEALQRLYPARVAIVDVQLRDGTEFSERIDAVRGSAENPMSQEEVAAKAHGLMTPFLGGDKSKKLIDAVLHLEVVVDIRTLRPLLQRS
jgi:2-methylcitrate dehydratase PrpD